MISSVQIAFCCYAEVNIVKAQDHPAWHGLIKGLQLLSTFSLNVHENQRQNQTLFPVQRRKEHQQCMPSLFTTCVWGVAINHQAKHNHFSKRQKRKIQAYPPFCRLADCISFHPTLSQISFPLFCKGQSKPRQQPLFQPQLKRGSQRCPNINYMFVHFWVTLGWPLKNLHWKGRKKVSSSCWAFPDANRLPLGH